MQNLDLDFRVVQLRQLLFNCFERTSCISSDDQVENNLVFLDAKFAGLEQLLECFEGNLLRSTRKRLSADKHFTASRNLPCLGDVIQDVESLACFWGFIKSCDIDGHRRAALRHLLVSLQRIAESLNTSKRRTADDNIAYSQRSALNHDLGDNTPIGCLFAFQTNANGGLFRIGFEFM